jgi:glycosyltransferase involved in cell wall biosynthesis
MTVSVVIPVYNVALCVERAIRSALDQSLPPIEVIVVDDGSTDFTCDVVSQLSRDDARVKLLKLSVNKGPAAARNAGIDSAQGDWIAILDADDSFFGDRLRYLVNAAERHDLTFAADNVTYYDASAQRATRLGIDPNRIGYCLDLDRYTYLRHCMMNQPGCIDIAGMKPIMRRTFLESSRVRYREDLRHGEDFLFYLRAIMAGARFYLFPISGYLYSERFGSISRQPSSFSRTIVNYRLMERVALELTSEPMIRSDPLLVSLLHARAEKIRALYRRRELGNLVQRRNLLALALQLVRHADARAYVSAAIRRKLMKLTASGETRL